LAVARASSMAELIEGREDGVTIVIVEDHDGRSLAGGDGEASSLVGGDLAGRSGVVDDFGIHFVSYADPSSWGEMSSCGGRTAARIVLG
jgi:hypothetical protein